MPNITDIVGKVEMCPCIMSCAIKFSRAQSCLQVSTLPLLGASDIIVFDPTFAKPHTHGDERYWCFVGILKQCNDRALFSDIEQSTGRSCAHMNHTTDCSPRNSALGILEKLCLRNEWDQIAYHELHETLPRKTPSSLSAERTFKSTKRM